MTFHSPSVRYPQQQTDKATATVTVNEKSMQQSERRTTSQTVHIGGQHKLNCKYSGPTNYWLKECVFLIFTNFYWSFFISHFILNELTKCVTDDQCEIIEESAKYMLREGALVIRSIDSNDRGRYRWVAESWNWDLDWNRQIIDLSNKYK